MYFFALSQAPAEFARYGDEEARDYGSCKKATESIDVDKPDYEGKRIAKRLGSSISRSCLVEMSTHRLPSGLTLLVLRGPDFRKLPSNFDDHRLRGLPTMTSPLRQK